MRGPANTNIELVSKICFDAGECDPQGLKPASFADLGGTAEAVPYPKPIYQTTDGVIPKARAFTSGPRNLACTIFEFGTLAVTRKIPHPAEVRRVSG